MSESKFGGPPRSKRGSSRWPEPDDKILKALDEIWASNRNGATVYFPVFETKGNPHDIVKGRIKGFIRDGIRDYRVTEKGVRAPKAFRVSPVFEDSEDQYMKVWDDYKAATHVAVELVVRPAEEPTASGDGGGGDRSPAPAAGAEEDAEPPS